MRRVTIRSSAATKRSHGAARMQQLTINTREWSSIWWKNYFCDTFSKSLRFSLTKCTSFEQTFELSASIEFILVQCKSSHTSDVERKKAKTVYSNAHAIVRRKQQMQNVFESFKTLYPNNERPLSVLMIGIDSISRLNLIRSMPMTAQYLYDGGWFELKGYNKVSMQHTLEIA